MRPEKLRTFYLPVRSLGKPVNSNPVVLKPTDSVSRVLTAAAVTVPDQEAYGLGFHMERFVGHP